MGSKDSDDSLISKKTWVKKMFHWVGTQGQIT